MGTSTSYIGPTGKNSLLPPWASPEEDHDGTSIEPKPTELIPWSVPKSLLTRSASSRNRENLKSAIRGFVQAQGGARGASRAAKTGRTSAQKLGGFLTSVVNQGVIAAINSLGLQEFIGQDVYTVLAALVDKIAPEGVFLEDSVARAVTAQITRLCY